MTKPIARFQGTKWALLCNFTPAPLMWEGIGYPTSEHAYNAGKKTDKMDRYRIATTPTPLDAKRVSRIGPMRQGWNETVRYEVMADVLRAKFAYHPDRFWLLLGTGDAELIEGNDWHDQHWGNCLCERPECAEPGQNRLGRLLMELRDELWRQT